MTSANNSFIGAGTNSKITNGDGNFIGAGNPSIISNGSYNAIICGPNNSITGGSFSMIGTGDGCTSRSTYSFIGAGLNLFISSGCTSTAIVCGQNNTINNNSVGSFIGAGNGHNLSGNNCFIGAGQAHKVIGDNSVIVGGSGNTATQGSCVVAGTRNVANGVQCFIGNGSGNTCAGDQSAIMTGQFNSIASGVTSSFILNGNSMVLSSPTLDSNTAVCMNLRSTGSRQINVLSVNSPYTLTINDHMIVFGPGGTGTTASVTLPVDAGCVTGQEYMIRSIVTSGAGSITLNLQDGTLFDLTGAGITTNTTLAITYVEVTKIASGPAVWVIKDKQ